MSEYPTKLDELSTSSQNSTTSKDTHPALHNDANAAIMALEATLGLDPQGEEATVAERLNSLSRLQFVDLEPGSSDYVVSLADENKLLRSPPAEGETTTVTLPNDESDDLPLGFKVGFALDGDAQGDFVVALEAGMTLQDGTNESVEKAYTEGSLGYYGIALWLVKWGPNRWVADPVQSTFWNVE